MDHGLSVLLSHINGTRLTDNIFVFSEITMPSYTTRVDRTSISILASNSEERSYTAVINFSWTHDDFEGNKIEKRVSITAPVQSRLKDGIILQLNGVNINVTDEFSVEFR